MKKNQSVIPPRFSTRISVMRSERSCLEDRAPQMGCLFHSLPYLICLQPSAISTNS